MSVSLVCRHLNPVKKGVNDENVSDLGQLQGGVWRSFTITTSN